MRRALIVLTAIMLAGGAASAQTVVTTETFVSAKPTDVLSYNLVGLNITSNTNETIGEIKDLISRKASFPATSSRLAAFSAWASATSSSVRAPSR